MSYLDEGMGLHGSFYDSVPYYNVGPQYNGDPAFLPPNATEPVKEYYIDPIMQYYEEFKKLK